MKREKKLPNLIITQENNLQVEQDSNKHSLFLAFTEITFN